MTTERLVLRRTEARDRSAYLDLICSPEVYRYLGGPHDRSTADLETPEVPGDRPGVFTVVVDDRFAGNVIVSRRDPERPGLHERGQGRELELSYLLLPEFWGKGYAFEACVAVLTWLAQHLPNEPVVLCTQSANVASVRLALRLGFSEATRFEEFGAEQWFGIRAPAP